jgi:hypothetical protein
MPRASTAAASGLERRGERVLQYHKETARRGLLVADLSQYPAWVRGLIYVAVVALFLGLAYGAFRATTSVRERAAGSETAPQPPEEPPPDAGH